MKQRVLFLIASDRYFHSHRLELALRAKKAGYDVVVATPKGPYVPAIEAAGLRHVHIPMVRQGRNPIEDLNTIKELVALFRREKPDLVHNVALKPILYGSIAARIARVPCVVNAIAGMGYVFLNDQLLSRVLRQGVLVGFRIAFAGENSKLILQNPDDIEAWISRGVVKRHQIALVRGAGVDVSRFKPTPEPNGPPLVVLPARLLFDKGISEFVEAARMVKSRGIPARFALVGEGDPGNPASVPPETAKKWEREGVMELFGWREDMPQVIAESAIVCLPSYGEGLPKALLEAAACGRPIVTTDVPGCREVVQEGRNGFLVPARDAKALGEALSKMLADPSLRKKMGQESRTMAETDFSIDRIAAQTLEVYADLLGRGH